MKAFEIIDAIEQMDPDLVSFYLHGDAAGAEKPSGSSEFTDCSADLHRTALRDGHERKIRVLSAAGVFGSIAACIALILGFWRISKPDPISTEQSSEILSLAESADTTMPAWTTVFKTVTVTANINAQSTTTTVSAPKTEKVSQQAEQNGAQADTPSASAGTQPSGITQASGRETTAKNEHLVAVPDLVGKTVSEVNQQYEERYMINVFYDPFPDDMKKEDYDPDKTIVYSQSIPAGTMIRDYDVITVHSSLSGFPSSSVSSLGSEIIGMQISDASDIVHNANYSMVETWSNQSDEPYGTVFHVSEVNPIGYVRCLVSNGIGNKMPELNGMSYYYATQLYGESIRIVVNGYVLAGDYDQKGMIVSQSVAPGAPIYRDFNLDAVSEDNLTTVYVTLTSSKEVMDPPSMPDLIGRVLDFPKYPYFSVDVFELVPDGDVKFRHDKTSDLPRGTIIAQDPLPGEPVWHDNKVTITLAMPDKISLPDLIGMHSSIAKNILIGEGLVPFVSESRENYSDLPHGTVVKVYPEDLSDLREGMGVRLYLSSED